MTTPTPRRPDDLVAALADAFDTVAPTTRAAAEEELNEAGCNSAKIAARFTTLAARNHEHGPRSLPAPTNEGRPWYVWAIAAGLILAVGAALVATRTAPMRIARPLPVPRTVELPDRHSPPSALNDPEAVAGLSAGRKTPGSGGASTDASGPAERRARADLGISLDEGALYPPSMTWPLRAGTLAFREITVDRKAIAGLQSAAFVEASAANAGRYTVDPSTCQLRAVGTDGPVKKRFGFPFPGISAGRPTAGCEIMWNVEAAFASGGGRRGRASMCANNRCEELDFVSLAFVGGPGDSIENSDSLRAASITRLVGGTASASGIFERDLLDGSDPHRALFIAETRRVRKLAPGPIDVDPPFDALAFAVTERNCLDGGPELYDWKIIGEKDAFAPLSGEGIPLGSAKDQKALTQDPVSTMPVMRRPVWVVEGSRRNMPAGTDRIVLYVDRELYRPYWKMESSRSRLGATYACGAAWARDGEIVAPLTSSVTRFQSDDGPISRFAPFDEVLDQNIRRDDVDMRVLTVMPQ